jgi:hypothetical protein
MKNVFIKAALACMLLSVIVGCSRKAGCPSNGKNVGAEKLLDGSKVPKAKKFKA